jgi:hypothetical protein
LSILRSPQQIDDFGMFAAMRRPLLKNAPYFELTAQRPAGRQQPDRRYVVKDHADSVLSTFKFSTGQEGLTPHVARVRHLRRRTADHWRAADLRVRDKRPDTPREISFSKPEAVVLLLFCQRLRGLQVMLQGRKRFLGEIGQGTL